MSAESESSHPFCGFCGNKNRPSFKFCAECGKPLEKLENSHSINEAQSKPKRSNHKNVRWLDNASRWEAFVQLGEKETILGQYEDEEEAATAANEYIKKSQELSRDTERSSKKNKEDEQKELKNLNIFINKIEKHLNQTLTEQAMIASRDFWEYYETIHYQLDKGIIKITIDPVFLNRSHPQYGQSYYARRGWGAVIFFIGFILLFNPQWLGIGIGIGLLGLIINSTAKSAGVKFLSELEERIKGPLNQNGIAYLAANYVTGVIQLKGPKGSAHWPQYPSCVLTGGKQFIADKNSTADSDTRGKLSGKLHNHSGIGRGESSMGAVKQLFLIILVCLLAYSNSKLILSGDVFKISPYEIPFKLIGSMFDTLVKIFKSPFG
jgi:hypothetical protein